MLKSNKCKKEQLSCHAAVEESSRSRKFPEKVYIFTVNSFKTRRGRDFSTFQQLNS